MTPYSILILSDDFNLGLDVQLLKLLIIVSNKEFISFDHHLYFINLSLLLLKALFHTNILLLLVLNNNNNNI